MAFAESHPLGVDFAGRAVADGIPQLLARLHDNAYANWPMTWIFNTAAMTATHDSGLRIQFEIVDDNSNKMRGTVIGLVPDSVSRLGQGELVRLVSEAGAGMANALKL